MTHIEVPENDLKHLLSALVQGVSDQIKPKSIKDFRTVCNNIEKFASAEGVNVYSKDLLDRYIVSIDAKLKS